MLTIQVTIKRSDNNENYMDNLHTQLAWKSGCKSLGAQLLLIRFTLLVEVAAAANVGF